MSCKDGEEMTIELIIENHDFKKGEFDSIETRFIKDYPVLYILYNKTKAYIGQTVNVRRRMADHLKNSERKGLQNSLLIGHEKFNQSATYNIETMLINHFLADGKFTLQNKSQLNSTQTLHNYYQKSYYNDHVFQEIWQELLGLDLAVHSSDVIQNRDVYKLSPFHELSPGQLEVKEKIIDFCKKNLKRLGDDEHKVFFIEGDAGTGKSVVLSSLYNSLCNMSAKGGDLEGANNYLLVNHSEVLKTYQTMSKSLPNMKKKNILKPTSFVNQVDNEKIAKADITLIDEAHLLLTSKDSYNNFNFENQLETIIERSKVTVIIFDPRQVLKIKSYWNQTKMTDIVSKYDHEILKLTDQFRMRASDDIVNWIDHFVNKKILPIPSSTDDYQFKIVSSPKELKETISSLDNEDKLSRIVSTFDYLHKKDGKKYSVDKGGVDLPWNIVSDGKVWAEDDITVNEVGSIYTVQGFDLNYVGVILGPSVSYDEKKDQLMIDHFKYQDKGAFTIPSGFDKNLVEQAKEEIILNSINILMKRGIKGLFIYATDVRLRDKLLQISKNRNEKKSKK